MSARFSGAEGAARRERWLADCDRALAGPAPSAGFLVCRAGLLALGGRGCEGWRDLMKAYETDPRLMALYGEGEFSLSPAPGKKEDRPQGRPEDVPDAEVLAALDAALKAEPRMKEAWAWRGILKRRALAYEDSAAALERAWSLGERTAVVATLLGEAKLQTGNASGLKDLERALSLPGRAAWNFAWRGRAGVAFGRDRAALRYFDEAIALDPGNGWSYAWRAEAKRQLGVAEGLFADFDKALELITAAGHRCFCLTWRALACAKLGEHGRALEDFGAALACLPAYGPALHGRAQSLRALGRLEDWFADLDGAARLDPKYLAAVGSLPAETLAELERDLGAVQAPAARGWRGLIRLLQGKAQQALADLDAAIRRAPKDARFYTWRAQARHQLGDAPRALADFARALKIDGASALTFAARAKLQLQRGELAAALADLDRAVLLDPRQAAFFADRGVVKLMLGDAAGAVVDLEQVALRDARYARVFADLAAACERLGRKKKAAEYRKRALSLDRAQTSVRLAAWEAHFRRLGAA